MALYAAFTRESSSEEMKKEQRQTLEAIGLDLREAVDGAGDCTWTGMTTKQRNTAMFWNSYKNTHSVASNNMRHTLDNFPNFSLIYLTMKKWQTSFFWY